MAKRKSRKEARQEVKRQGLRRRAGDVKRFEVVLIADSERDQYISHWMNEHLGYGEASEFARLALEEKIARHVGGDMRDMIEAMVSQLQNTQSNEMEIDMLKAKIEQLEVQAEQNAQEIKHLWREMGRMNDRLEQLRAHGVVEDDDLTTPISQDDARQAALSDKLKAMKGQFNVLKQ